MEEAWVPMGVNVYGVVKISVSIIRFLDAGACGSLGGASHSFPKRILGIEHLARYCDWHQCDSVLCIGGGLWCGYYWRFRYGYTFGRA
jgi:hypothetical protein